MAEPSLSNLMSTSHRFSINLVCNTYNSNQLSSFVEGQQLNGDNEFGIVFPTNST